MRARLSAIARAVFLITLAVYLLFWLTVSYVGVKVTYVAGPILLVSGLATYLLGPGGGPRR